jgi:hypothetical protein
MRLETPVVYFHPPAGARLPITLDVSAAFHGGWLTQYYPDAKAHGFAAGTGSALGPITGDTIGSLTWSNVRVGTDGQLAETTDHVWTTPRKVDAATITVVESQGRDESEKYLFYRGVGHIEAPLQATRNADRIVVHERVPFGHLWRWLAEFRADGTCAFRTIADDRQVHKPADLDFPAKFTDEEFSKGNVAELRRQMRKNLIFEGLFEDEAEAMLATWELSYFKSPGTRVFYVVPRWWVDQRLPLTISVDAKVTRVMIGRVELVTERERKLLKQIADVPVPTARMQPGDATTKAWKSLGRFCNALVLDELRRRSTESLRQFIVVNNLQPFAVRKTPENPRPPGP